MKFSKIILSVAVAGAILGGAVTTASANPATSGQTTYPQQTVSTAQPTHQVTYGNQNNQTVPTSQTTNQTTQSTGAPTSSSSNQANAVVSLAKKLATQSIPYVWGGESLSGMDCSGLTDYVYQKAAGISLGHYTVTQESHVTKKAVANAQPGDLLFWGSQGASYHVAIYIGNNQYVAAPQPGQNVEIQTINSAFMPSFAGHVNG